MSWLGHLTAVFCKISVTVIFYGLRRVKNFEMTVPFTYNFRNKSNDSLRGRRLEGKGKGKGVLGAR